MDRRTDRQRQTAGQVDSQGRPTEQDTTRHDKTRHSKGIAKASQDRTDRQSTLCLMDWLACLLVGWSVGWSVG